MAAPLPCNRPSAWVAGKRKSGCTISVRCAKISPRSVTASGTSKGGPVGRASRRRKSSQAARDLKRRLLAADRAERRGQAVPPTVEGYEAAAGAGPIAVQEALLARHNARMIRFANPRRANYAGIRSVLGPAAHAAMALTRLGADPDRWPCDPYGSWADHLRWGIDSVTATARLVFAGQIVGAAMLIRQQLERWTENLAHNARLYQNRGESRAEYITRVWACDRTRPPPGAMRRGFSLAHQSSLGTERALGNCFPS